MKWSGLIGTVATVIFCGALSNPAHAFRTEAYGCSNTAGGDGQLFASNAEICFAPGQVQIGTNSSSANLATGEIKTAVTSSGPFMIPGGGLLADTLTIQGPFSSTDPIPVTLSMHIDGSMIGTSNGQLQAGLFSLLAGGESGISQSFLGITNPDPQGNVSIANSINGGNGTFQNRILSLLASDIDLILSVQVDVSSAQPTLGVTASAGFTAAPGITLDFSNTAALALALPQGFTFTSDSGVFLSQVPPETAPVPEPGTWMLLGTGLVGLLGYGWRKQRQIA